MTVIFSMMSSNAKITHQSKPIFFSRGGWIMSSVYGTKRFISHKKLHKIIDESDGNILIMAQISSVKKFEPFIPMARSENDPVYHMFNSITNSDFWIDTSDKKRCFAHKNILFPRVNDKIYESSVTSSDNVTAAVVNFGSRIVQEFLRYLYLGTIDKLEEVEEGLFAIAKMYGVEDLANICLNSIRINFENRSLRKTVKFAEIFDLDDIFELCVEKCSR